MVLINAVRKDLYADSVALMRIAATLTGEPGVETVSLVMGTPANKEVLSASGLLTADGTAAGPNDLLLAVRGTREAADTALGRAVAALRDSGPEPAGRAEGEEDLPVRSLATAPPGTDLAVISVPGAYAAAETRKALRAGMHAFVFSDHVDLADEVALKTEAAARGLLVMGPDCGTAVVAGVPLGFANAVRPGPVGLVGASGTGLQQVACLLHARGSGVSHVLGTGSRDVSREVGGLTMLAALDALAADPATERIVLVSKPPDPEVARRVLARAAACGTPVVACFLGWEGPVPEGVVRATTLAEAAEAAAPGNAPRPDTPIPDSPLSRPAAAPLLRALYTGGTFAHEAHQLLAPRLADGILRQLPASAAELPARHLVLDLGDDAYTAGRPHPMIDPTVRTALLRAALADPRTGLVLVDIVLGHGAAPDPAGALLDALAAAGHTPASGPPVLAFVVGTDADPQPAAEARRRLRAAGVLLADSSTHAARLAAAHLAPAPAPVPARGGARA
ncbi:acyl-CoA synthetase FdrA [Streptomyces sp. NPDC002248]